METVEKYTEFAFEARIFWADGISPVPHTKCGLCWVASEGMLLIPHRLPDVVHVPSRV